MCININSMHAITDVYKDTKQLLLSKHTFRL